MPLARNRENPRPSTLVELCYANIVRNVELISARSPADVSFASLPETLLLRIINTVRKADTCSVGQLNCLLTNDLTFLDLSNHNHLFLSELLPIIMNNCQLLQKMDLSRNSYGFTITLLYERQFRFFSHLRVLDLSGMRYVGDCCMSVIGVNCHLLQELNVSETGVSNEGIRRLCIAEVLTNPLLGANQLVGQCRSLVKLNVYNTDVTYQGAQLALENLPLLENFKCKSSLFALAEIHRTARHLEAVRLLDLFSTRSDINSNFVRDASPRYVPGSLVIAVRLCRLVTRVELFYCSDLEDSDLLALRDLSNLKQLYIRACRPLTFNGGIRPVLDSVGATITELILDETAVGVDILVIAEACPNVEVFHALKTTDDEPQEELGHRLPIFRKLKELKLGGFLRRRPTVSADDLRSVLFSRRLVSVELNHCHVTDEVLLEANVRHQFSRLERLTVLGSRHLTSRGVDVFMTPANPLRILSLALCPLISVDEKNAWSARARAEHWNVQMHFQ